jgi:hypothetical protein
VPGSQVQVHPRRNHQGLIDGDLQRMVYSTCKCFANINAQEICVIT